MVKSKVEGWKELLLAMLFLGVWMGVSVEAGEEPDRPLRIVSYNLLHGGPASGFIDTGTHVLTRLDRVVKELQALQPDIIALQEASWSRRYGNIPERLARRLGLNVIFAPATERLVGIWPLDRVIVGLLGFKEGPAILSRFPIAASEIYDLPRGQRVLDPRILLRADVTTPWGLLHIFSTHTSGQPCQAEHIGRIVSERRSRNPSVVMGDFNALETSPGLVTLREKHGFVDVFRFANPAIPGLTVWQRIEANHSTVSRRVDYLFVINGRELIATIRSSRLAFDQPGRLLNGGFLWPSDHYGVLGELEFLPPESRPR